MSDNAIFEIHASILRRVIAFSALAFAGGGAIYLAFSDGSLAFATKIMLLLVGGLVLAFAMWFYRATGQVIALTDEGLRLGDGRWLCRLEDIEKVDRGAFAMKPNGGFNIRLLETARAEWAPGMWWRIGRTLGVGGVTDRAMSKAVGEYLALALAERNKVDADK